MNLVTPLLEEANFLRYVQPLPFSSKHTCVLVNKCEK